MSIENFDVVNSTDTDFEYHVAGLSESEAESAVNRVMSDEKSAYWDGHALHHDRTVERLVQLRKAAKPPELDPETGERLPYVDPIYAKALEEVEVDKAARQADLVAKAQDDMDVLVEAGFDYSTIPDDLTPSMGNLLHMQRLGTEGEYGEVAPLMQKELRGLEAPPATIQLFNDFVQADVDPKFKHIIFSNLLEWIKAEHEYKNEIERKVQ